MAKINFLARVMKSRRTRERAERIVSEGRAFIRAFEEDRRGSKMRTVGSPAEGSPFDVGLTEYASLPTDECLFHVFLFF